jgi:hypothetical protein
MLETTRGRKRTQRRDDKRGRVTENEQANGLEVMAVLDGRCVYLGAEVDVRWLLDYLHPSPPNVRPTSAPASNSSPVGREAPSSWVVLLPL